MTGRKKNSPPRDRQDDQLGFLFGRRQPLNGAEPWSSPRAYAGVAQSEVEALLRVERSA